MKQQLFLKDYKNIADIHALRLNESLEKILPLMPLTADKLSKLNTEQIAFIDMLTMRFSKLQDIIGSKIFSLILEILAEDALAFVDKLNKLEKLGYLENTNWWMEIREIRNQITHDYPDDYETIVVHIQILLLKTRELLDFWEGLKEKIVLIGQ